MSAKEYYEPAPDRQFHEARKDQDAVRNDLLEPSLPPAKQVEDSDFSITKASALSPLNILASPPSGNTQRTQTAEPIPPPPPHPSMQQRVPTLPLDLPLDSSVSDDTDDRVNHFHPHVSSYSRSHHRPEVLNVDIRHAPSSRRHRRREKELAMYSKETLMHLLSRKEYEVDENRRLARIAATKLEYYVQRTTDLEAQRKSWDLERRKLLDETVKLNMKASEAVLQARNQTHKVQQELEVSSFRLQHAEEEVERYKRLLQNRDNELKDAQKVAARARDVARQLREEAAIHEAHKKGHQEGFDEALKQARVLVSQPNVTLNPVPNVSSSNHTAVNEPPILGDGTAFIEEYHDIDTSLESDRTRGSRARPKQSIDPGIPRLEFEDAIRRVREEEHHRLQRELEVELNRERERLKRFEEDRERQREKEREEDRRKFTEIETIRQAEHLRAQEQLRTLELERQKERELREKEQRERKRERELLQRERERELESRERERERLKQEVEKIRQRDQELLQEKDRELEQQRERVTAAEVAAAVASATTHSMDLSSDSSSVAPAPSLSYLPMPPPPITMPTPSPSMPIPSVSMPVPSASTPNASVPMYAAPTQPSTTVAYMTMPEPSVSRQNPPPALPTTTRTARKQRRPSIDSQSSASTVNFDLVSFPPYGRASSSGSSRATAQSSRPPSALRGGPYSRPPINGRDALIAIPEDASIRASSPEYSSRRSPPNSQPPEWLTNPPPDMSKTSGPPPPISVNKVDVQQWRTGSSSGYSNQTAEAAQRYMPTVPTPLNMEELASPRRRNGTSLSRSNSHNSARSNASTDIKITFISPSPPTSPVASPPDGHEASSSNHFLTPGRAAAPLPMPTNPVLPHRAESPALPVKPRSTGRGPAQRRVEAVPEPRSPTVPPEDLQNLPPGFIPQTFTPRATSPVLDPDTLPPGFVPQAITDTFTGITTPLHGAAALPTASAPVIPTTSTAGLSSRRQSVYGNPLTTGGHDSTLEDGDGAPRVSPYLSTSPLPTGPPVIPHIPDNEDESQPWVPGISGPQSKRISHSPGNSLRSMPLAGTPAGGGVYQNPLIQDEREGGDGDGEGDGDGDGGENSVTRQNTRINATTQGPPPTLTNKRGKNKKKRG